MKVVQAVRRDEREQRGADGDEEVRPQAGLALPDLALDADRAAENPGQRRRAAASQPKWSSGTHGLDRVLLGEADLLDAGGREVEQLVELVAVERRALGRRLHLDRRPSPVMTTLTSTSADESSE